MFTLGQWFAESESSLTVAKAAVEKEPSPMTVAPDTPKESAPLVASSALMPRQHVDTSGYATLVAATNRWPNNASLTEIRKYWEGAADRLIAEVDQGLESPNLDWRQRASLAFSKASCFMSAAKPDKAYEALEKARAEIEEIGGEARQATLATLIFFQGVAALRLGENENCIMCRGESSCILPISPAAVHQFPKGSRLAIDRFTELLKEFPDDLEVRWLLNLAHMTLGEHPEKVDPRYVISLDRFRDSQLSIGKFRDVGHLVGVNRFNQAGGSILEDFDDDGLLDLAVSSFDPTQPLDLYRNTGTGTFEAVSHLSPQLDQQLGGLVCIQTDYDNDGRMDILVPRGAWLRKPIRPSLLRNEGNFRFTDVTEDAGLIAPVNSNAAAWADYDNDGFVDLFICCEKQAHRLYRNLGNGKFEERASEAGLTTFQEEFGKGCTWIDYDNDDYPDLFINYLAGTAQLFHNDRNGSFTNVSSELGIQGPQKGFSCWTFDYDNDGWLDIFATCYDSTLADIVNGITGKPHNCYSNRLYRNLEGKRFQDVTKEVGLDMVFATMGSNYGDLDNDGFLDFYLGTGAPDLSLLIPNRMFKNVAGKEFVEISGAAGVGHLQKGHGVAIGDWDRDGNVDIFIEMGGAVDGDKFHNILFQNPGHDQAWLSVKLVGTKTNRAALGVRIKVLTDGEAPLTVHRHVSPGSSFGGNPLEQTIGLGKAEKVARLEIRWPTSGQTQVLTDLSVNQAIEITEGAEGFRPLERKRVPLPTAE